MPITMPDYLSTSKVAKSVGVHPNTVRLYEKWGFLPPVQRSPKGYRRFTQRHLDTMRLARTALHGGWPGKSIRESSVTIVRKTASGDLGGALVLAYHHLGLVKGERAQAEAAVQLLERWAQGTPAETEKKPLHVKEVKELLGVTFDMLRHWERNGLLKVPRDPANGYRLYGAPEISRLRVIRMLSRAGYSTMAILRMLTHLDSGGKQLREALDTPRPDEDVYAASNRWLSELAEQESRASEMIRLLEEMLETY